VNRKSGTVEASGNHLEDGARPGETGTVDNGSASFSWFSMAQASNQVKACVPESNHSAPGIPWTVDLHQVTYLRTQLKLVQELAHGYASVTLR
jgi:hypothetical protein